MALRLLATHLDDGQTRWLPVNDRATLYGRAALDGQADKVVLDFDPTLSRSHFTAYVQDGRLHVRADKNRHPLLFRHEERREFEVVLGETFTSGRTRFELVDDEDGSLQPLSTHTVVLGDVQAARLKDPERYLQAILDLQPLMQQGLEAEELLRSALPLLARLVPGASQIEVLRNMERLAVLGPPGLPVPEASRTLVKAALACNEPTVHNWTQSPNVAATVSAGVQWAVAVPVEDGNTQYVLYAIGMDEGLAESPGALDQQVLAFVGKILEARPETPLTV